MKKIALVYWPEGGNVETVAEKIFHRFEDDKIEKNSVASIDQQTLSDFDYLIVGGSTVGSHVWEDADDSNKWHKFFNMLDNIDLSSKTVAFFGLGDQVLYPHHFVDGLGVFREEFEKRGAKIIGQWPVKGYEFIDSEGMKDEMFYGIALDEDNQAELTDERLDSWLPEIKKEFGF